jgi:hypothetical protein
MGHIFVDILQVSGRSVADQWQVGCTAVSHSSHTFLSPGSSSTGNYTCCVMAVNPQSVTARKAWLSSVLAAHAQSCPGEQKCRNECSICRTHRKVAHVVVFDVGGTHVLHVLRGVEEDPTGGSVEGGGVGKPACKQQAVTRKVE